jgi:hypothetical protein
MPRPLGFKNRGKSSVKKIAQAERNAVILRYRAEGLQYEQIHAKLKAEHGIELSQSRVYGIVCEGIAAITAEPSEHLRRLENRRLDELMNAYWTQATKTGDMQAAIFCLKVIEARSKLNGLYPKDGTGAGNNNVLVNVQAGDASRMENLTLEEVLPLVRAAGFDLVPMSGTKEGTMLTEGEEVKETEK